MRCLASMFDRVIFYYQKFSYQRMAFVYCGQRWRQQPQNQVPGPGNYDLDRVQTPQKKKSSHHKTAFVKQNSQKIIEQTDNNVLTQTWYSQDRINCTLQQYLPIKRQTQHKGKIYRNTTSNKADRTKLNQDNPILQIKNRQQELLPTVSRDQWGNHKIIQLLKQHKDHERRRKPIKKGQPIKRNVFTCQSRQKMQADLKQLEVLFHIQQNRNENTLSLKNLHRTIASQQKQRQHNSHNYYTTVNRAMNELKDSRSNEELSVQPSAIYKSATEETQFFSRPQTPLQASRQLYLNPKCKVNKNQSLQTGITDDLLDDSMEYISDATPGPGSYNLRGQHSQKKTSGKKIQQFGVTMERFKVKRDTKGQSQAYLSPSMPTFKRTTQARQQAVGFGRSTKEEKEQEYLHQGIFYEDLKTMENSCKQMLSKKSKNKDLCFETHQERFPYRKGKRQDQDFLQEPQESESDEEAIESPKIPTCVFMSKVQRQVAVPNSITQNVDFHGQNYSCLAHKIKRQREHIEDYEIQPAPFMAKDNRFKYVEPKKEEKKEQLKLIKVKELKEKKEHKEKPQSKGYSFAKEVRKERKVEKVSPSPDKYELEPSWIKQTYNLRFR